MNKKKLIELRCKAWGITEIEYYCNQCSDFSLEDMARAYRRGKNKGKAETALLSQHILELQADKGNLTDRVKELEAQNEEMKCCGNCYYFNIDKNIGIGNLFCDLKLLKNGYCRNNDHWKFFKEIKEND
jgi:hypothetical protein